MKALILIFCLLSGAIANANWQPLPATTVNSKILGGTIILVQMTQTLLINGDENQKILLELGQGGRKDFFRDLVMNVSAAEIKKAYGQQEHPTTNAVIAKYESLSASLHRLTLN